MDNLLFGSCDVILEVLGIQKYISQPSQGGGVCAGGVRLVGCQLRRAAAGWQVLAGGQRWQPRSCLLATAGGQTAACRGSMGPWARGPWARGPWHRGPWARGPMGLWARGPVGPWVEPMGPCHDKTCTAARVETILIFDAYLRRRFSMHLILQIL